MKKLMIAFAAVAMAAVASAANVNWTCTNVYKPDTSTKMSGYIAYLFDTATVSDKAAVEAAILGGTFTKSYVNTLMMAATGTSNTSGTIVKAPAVTGLEAGTKSYYTVLFDAGSESAAENYIITSTLDLTIPTSGAASALWQNVTGTGSGSNWKAIPEPTSGLLLLLGVAGLALKRKRA